MQRSKISEYCTVQKTTIEYLSQPKAQYGEQTYTLNWQPIRPDQYRDSKASPILSKVFFEQIKKLNPGISEKEARRIYNELNSLMPTINGNWEAWKYLKEEKNYYDERERREIAVKLIDRENLENNIYQVAEEFEYAEGDRLVRFDIVFFINGIPVAFQENKSPTKERAMAEAIEQVKRYHQEARNFLKLTQVFSITNGLSFIYGPTWLKSLKDAYTYRLEDKSYKQIVEEFYSRENFIKLVLDYIHFLEQDGEVRKVILKPHQIRAVEKIIQTAKDEQKLRGLIWHTQGSGKTLTMITAAKLIYSDRRFENPTILMIVDRNELEAQTFKTLESAGISVRRAETKEDLKDILTSDYGGIVLSTIHKFNDLPPELNKRKNIFVFIDEAHRSIYGKLGNHLIGALPNATFIGFTGTPVVSSRVNTFLTFEGYLDKYSIIQSIKDGTTLKLHYLLAPSKYQLREEDLEKDLEALKSVEGDIEDLNRAIEQLSSKVFLEDPNRIQKIAEYIAWHFKEYVEPLGYKAFVVAVSRKACAIYKKELDKHFPEDYSQVVISPYYNDEEELKKHHKSPEEERKVREDFKNPERLPKILIVTDKLLTGFDAPILYCIYLDKIMRDHVLLQTIARANRPYEKDGREKPAGLIVDFVGILKNLKKALEFDLGDIEEISGALTDLKHLRKEFEELMRQLEEYLRNWRSVNDSVNDIAEFMKKLNYEKFKKLYKKVKDIYDILSPDSFLSKYQADFAELTQLYRAAKNWFEPSTPVDKELSQKVKALVYEYSQFNLKSHWENTYEINEHLLQKLKEKSPEIKIFNLVISLQKDLEKHSNKPYVRSMIVKLSKLKEEYNENHIDSANLLEELRKLIQEKIELEEKEKQLGIFHVSVFHKLREYNINNVEEVSMKITELFNKYPHWKESEGQERELTRKLVGLLKDFVQDLEKASYISQNLVDFLKYG